MALDPILHEGGVRTLFQPIVDLGSGETAGFEALARGPAGSELEPPGDLFAAARAAGRLAELDWLCRVTAARTAVALGLTAPLTVFVNVEPDTLHVAPPAGIDPEEFVHAELRIAVELTERSLTAQPAALVAAALRIRELGWGVALDDVGADPRSLALLPVLSADVVKLDLRLVQERPDRDVAAVANAVNAYAERTGTTILAEGIETEQHLEIARSLGATLGQGWLLGRPTAEPVVERPERPVAFPRQISDGGSETPYEIAARIRPPAIAAPDLLLSYSTHLELQAGGLPEAPILLSCFQTAERFTPAVAVRYSRLGARLPFVAALGRDMPEEPAEAVFGSGLEDGDPLVEQWAVVVLGPHFAGALVAREADPERRRFHFVLTYNRPVVAIIARNLMRRLSPRPGPSIPG